MFADEDEIVSEEIKRRRRSIWIKK